MSKKTAEAATVENFILIIRGGCWWFVLKKRVGVFLKRSERGDD